MLSGFELSPGWVPLIQAKQVLKQVVNKVLNFCEGDIVVDYQKYKETSR